MGLIQILFQSLLVCFDLERGLEKMFTNLYFVFLFDSSNQNKLTTKKYLNHWETKKKQTNKQNHSTGFSPLV